MNSNAAYTIFPDGDTLIPRFRVAGDVTLDLIHRDGRVEAKWIGFHPREFELLWRLAETPGRPMTKKQLLADVWRLDFEPESNSVAVHVARVRAKLSTYGLDAILVTHPEGGYFLDVPPEPSAFSFGAPKST
ncbi:winged helix-turn-helix transcriptional regulator [Erythrobacter insulae]|uniref:Winged helix-turn-helix transcriptional regulator n=1 Tax=Erythrobacter insulae TaxID=2584124 RepID=A0A547PCB7_9SPHN|nr:winged helix-turn-helix domain-containing protein [Erythrobacter insulae]TRD11789.1 winged helix-turn-helix transcriptional regulator [Erythrobacter insulae]